MLSILCMTLFFGSTQVQQPAFIITNHGNESGKKMIANDAVIAFAQTPEGRVLFSPFGAFVGVANGPDSTAVLQVGFSPKKHKRGLNPSMGKQLPTQVNYFNGSSQSWQKKMASHGELSYAEVWPGIDLTFLTRGTQLEFQLHLAPGAEVTDVEMVTGADALRVEGGALVASLEHAELRLSPPIAFQTLAGKQIKVPVNYKVLTSGAFGFELGAYDRSQPLIIDPVLSWSTFFGGGGANSESDRAVVIEVNDANEAIFAGETTGPDFPVTPGAFSNQIAGNRDIFVGKLSADGTTFQFLTLIGSSDDDRVYDLELDASENIYITGEVRGPDFPTTPGAFNRNGNNDDAYVTKFNPDGSALLFSTYLGGSGSDEGDSLIVEPSGTVLAFLEAPSPDMPTTPGAPNPTLNGGQDIFIARLSADGSQVLFGSYFGGTESEDLGDAIRLDDGRIVFVGESGSTDLPTTMGAFNETSNGEEDTFVAILSTDLSTFTHVTYVGGSEDDTPVNLGVDGSGNIIVGGYTSSNDFPTTAGAFDETFNGDRDGTVFKLSADLSTLQAATYLGTPEREFIRAMAVDNLGQPVVLGTTRDMAFPTTAGAFDQTFNGETDIFAAKLSSDLTTLIFSSFLGGNESESPGGVVLDSSGNIYGAGGSSSSDFPVTVDNRNGNSDSLIFKLSADGSTQIYANLFGGGSADRAADAIRLPSGETLFSGEAGANSFPTTAGVFDDQIVKRDAFVAKMDATGSSLVFSTFLGGSGNEGATNLALDSMGHIIVGGFSSSTDFPITPGVLDTTLDGQDDMFIAKLSPMGDALSFATFLGGTSFGTLNDIAVADDNTLFVVGNTGSADFPVTMGAFDETFNGVGDAFVAKIAADATALEYSTFLGTSGFDQGTSIAVDSMGQAIVSGTTQDGFPTTPGAFDETHNNGIDAYICKFNAAGSALVFSTYLGGNGGEVLTDMVIGPGGEISVTGNTGSGFPTTAGAVQETFSGANDAYVSTLSADGTQLLFSTYLGGMGVDGATALSMDADGNLVVAGETNSTDFPVTANAFQDSLYDEQDGFIALLGCNGTQLQYSSFFGAQDDEEVEALASNGDGTFVVYGETEGPSFPTTTGAFDQSFTGTKELFLIEFDLRSESLFTTNTTGTAQGISVITLEALLPPCAANPLDVQWFNETEGTNFPLNTNPISLTPAPLQSLTLRVDITNTVTMNTSSRRVTVLVSQNPLYFDLNSDGCNDFADIHTMAPSWLTSVVDDPNGDGTIDVRDFLYINTDNQGACPISR